MQIKIDWKIIIFVLFFFIINTWKIYILFLIYALIHEIAHMIVGIILGDSIEKIYIMPIGVSLSFKININDCNRKVLNGTYCSLKKILIALAGPISNIIFALIFKKEYQIIGYINLIIAMFNLLPIYPLDGGRIIKHVLIILFGRRKGLKYTNHISNIVMITIAIFTMSQIKTVGYMMIVSLIYLIMIRIKNHKVYKMKEKIYQIIEANSN